MTLEHELRQGFLRWAQDHNVKPRREPTIRIKSNDEVVEELLDVVSDVVLRERKLREAAQQLKDELERGEL